MSAEPVLSVRRLTVAFDASVSGRGASERLTPAVDDVSFEVPAKAVLGIVGESGSGKSMTALAVMGLLPTGARAFAGEVMFEGRNLLGLPELEMHSLRGRGIAMIFQEPAMALSPVHSVGWHLDLARQPRAGPLPLRDRLRRASREHARELLASVELPDPEKALDAYPFQLSAGMRRRVLIAMALAAEPRLLIADEPTTGLDAPVQAQILDLLTRLTTSRGLSTVFISHDPEVVAEVSSETLVMHSGQIVEAGPTARIFREPQHPYTLALLDAVRARRGLASHLRTPGSGPHE